VKIYIASRNQEAGQRLRALVQSLGHQVTSRWLDEAQYTGIPAEQQEKVRAAIENLEDVQSADLLILRAEPDGSFVPGGKHVETGAALAWGKPVLVLGRPENVFHWHPLVTIVDEGGLIEYLRGNGADSQRAGVPDKQECTP
jgi:hypothetical protein